MGTTALSQTQMLFYFVSTSPTTREGQVVSTGPPVPSPWLTPSRALLRNLSGLQKAWQGGPDYATDPCHMLVGSYSQALVALAKCQRPSQRLRCNQAVGVLSTRA